MGNTQPVTSINVWVLIGRATDSERFSTTAAVRRLYVSVEGKEEKDEETQQGEFQSGNERRRRKEGNEGVAVAAGAS